MQTIMILTVCRTDQSTLETTNETAASPLLPPLTQRLRQDQRGRASLVIDTQYYAVDADNAGEKYLRG